MYDFPQNIKRGKKSNHQWCYYVSVPGALATGKQDRSVTPNSKMFALMRVEAALLNSLECPWHLHGHA